MPTAEGFQETTGHPLPAQPGPPAFTTSHTVSVQPGLCPPVRREVSLTDPLPHLPISHGDGLFSEPASGERITMLNIMPTFQNHLQLTFPPPQSPVLDKNK